jgi:hypothetical protein
MRILLWTTLALASTPLTPSQQAMHKALSGRDVSPPCEQLEALSDTPLEDLKVMVERVSAPPWAGMRAAQCLVDRHPDAIGEELDRWVTDPALVGLGILVLNRLDDLPVATAIRVASLALEEGAPRLDAKKRVSAAARQEVRSLVQP